MTDNSDTTPQVSSSSNNDGPKSLVRDTKLETMNLSPSTIEALKTLSTISAGDGVEALSNCDKLTASLEQIRAKKNMKLFEKLDKIRKEFSGLNHKIARMEESITDLKEVTNDLVKSLPTSDQ